MSNFQPVQPEQVQQSCQIGLAVLSDEECRIPGNLVEGIMSFKSLLNALIQGSLVICQDVPAKPEDGQTPPKKEAASPKKKVAKKTKNKAAPEKSS